MKINYRLISVLLTCLLASLACLQSGSGVVPARPVPMNPAGTPEAIHTVALLSATPEATSTITVPTIDTGTGIVPPIFTKPGLWVVVRDPGDGFGFAVPCWWQVGPIPEGGTSGAITLRSYDDAYFKAHSIKGEWTDGVWPEGAVKVDLATWGGFDPKLTTLEAYRTSFDPSMSEIVDWQERRLGENTANYVEMRNLVNPADPDTPLYLFRLSPDKLLIVSALPVTALESSDVLAIVNSLAIAPKTNVRLPQIMPSPAIIPIPDSCQEYVPQGINP